ACWADGVDGFGDILGTEPAGENDRDADLVDDPPADGPIMSAAEGAELPGTDIVAVEQQKIGDTPIGPGDLYARLVDDRDRTHDRDFGEPAAERAGHLHREFLEGRLQLDDVGPGFSGNPRHL